MATAHAASARAVAAEIGAVMRLLDLSGNDTNNGGNGINGTNGTHDAYSLYGAYGVGGIGGGGGAVDAASIRVGRPGAAFAEVMSKNGALGQRMMELPHVDPLRQLLVALRERVRRVMHV